MVKIGINEPFMYKLVDITVEIMKDKLTRSNGKKENQDINFRRRKTIP
jgi:hypothetical protein